jgi:hypothetical protein
VLPRGRWCPHRLCGVGQRVVDRECIGHRVRHGVLVALLAPRPSPGLCIGRLAAVSVHPFYSCYFLE